MTNTQSLVAHLDSVQPTGFRLPIFIDDAGDTVRLFRHVSAIGEDLVMKAGGPQLPGYDLLITHLDLHGDNVVTGEFEWLDWNRFGRVEWPTTEPSWTKAELAEIEEARMENEAELQRDYEEGR